MKKNSILIVLFFCVNIFAQKTDIWSGDYFVKSADLTPIDTFRIVKIADVNADDLPDRLANDVNRWNMMSKNDQYSDKIKARNFSYNPAEKEDAYEEFGWTKLYLKGKMNCLDMGHLFLCQTTPNSKVVVNNKEEFFTESGIFGVRLHYGLIKLEKVKDQKQDQ